MQADEIKERIDEIAEMGSAKTLAAFMAAVAALLAVATLGGSNAAEDKANENIHASDTWAFYQAKTAPNADETGQPRKGPVWPRPQGCSVLPRRSAVSRRASPCADEAPAGPIAFRASPPWTLRPV